MNSTYELKIDGVSDDEIKKIAEYYRVGVDFISDGSGKDGTLRISFHPFMGDDAIKILGYVLRLCVDPEAMKASEYYRGLR